MKFFSIIFHPILILPWGILIAFSTGARYEPWEIATASIPIILQGGTDWGGSCLFAGWVANYLFFFFCGFHLCNCFCPRNFGSKLYNHSSIRCKKNEMVYIFLFVVGADYDFSGYINHSERS